MILWWILVVAAIVFFMTWVAKQSSRPRQERSALDILKERYARGELSKQEFEEKKRDVA